MGQLAVVLALGACSDKLLHHHEGSTTAAEDEKRHKLQHKLMRRLAKQLEGSYNSTEQAFADHDKDYHDVRLHIRRIWKNRSESEGLYFYQEQARTADPLHPTQQRVFRLSLRPDDDKIEAQYYTLRGAKRFTGQWQTKEKEPLAGLTPDSLVQLPGCALLVVQNTVNASGFRATTEGQNCLNSESDAYYSTIDLTTSPTDLIYWERGFDVAGRLVWGPPLGGYFFKKDMKKKPKSTDAPTQTKTT